MTEKRVKAWAVVDKDGELFAPSFDERLWIFVEDHREQAEAFTYQDGRVVPVEIVIQEEGDG